MAVRRIISDHPVATMFTLLGGLTLAVIVLVWFQPQKLLIDARVDESLSVGPPQAVVASDQALPPPPAVAAQAPGGEPERPSSPEQAPAVVAHGTFRSLEHTTRGSASLVRLADGSHVVRFENLDTSNGPDLRVYLSAAPAHARASELNDDFVDLGPLKANQGNHNYPVPPGVDLTRYRSVTIWCRRFSVGFAVAPLA
ncbi:MAG: DM13 domain-containing protein [Nitriliruptorales bacterium]